MANVTFCYPNWTLPTALYTPTVTGASWLDLANLQGEVLSEMARFPGVNPASTKLVIDLATLRAARVFALPFQNAKLGDTARIRFATDAAFSNVVLDTGFKEFFGEAYPYGSLEWGRPEWMDGKLTPEQAAVRSAPWVHVAPSDLLGRYVEVSLNFSGNSDGFADLGQVIVSPAITPKRNISYGYSAPCYRDPSTKRRAKGGPQFADKARPYRYAKMQLEWLDDSELYGMFFEMIREYGVAKPFFYIHDSDAPPAILPKQSFMATAESFSDPVHLSYGRFSLTIEISESF